MLGRMQRGFDPCRLSAYSDCRNPAPRIGALFSVLFQDSVSEKLYATQHFGDPVDGGRFDNNPLQCAHAVSDHGEMIFERRCAVLVLDLGDNSHLFQKILCELLESRRGLVGLLSLGRDEQILALSGKGA